MGLLSIRIGGAGTSFSVPDEFEHPPKEAMRVASDESKLLPVPVWAALLKHLEKQ
jgi:hypothetical protein